MNTVKWSSITCLISLVSFSFTVGAQEPESVPVAAPPAEDETTDRLNALNEKVATIEQQMAAVEQRAAQQEKETAAVKEELADTRKQQEDLMLSVAELSTAEEEGRLRIFGFMDTSFTASFPEKKGGSYKWDTPVFALTPRRNTFYMANVNLFFKSEMTRTLEAWWKPGLPFSPMAMCTSIPLRGTWRTPMGMSCWFPPTAPGIAPTPPCPTPIRATSDWAVWSWSGPSSTGNPWTG